MQAQPSSVATRNGVIAGIILGILSLPVMTLSVVGAVARLGGGLSVMFLLIALVVFAVAGFSASRRNGLIRSGAWAGFLAGLITAFIAICLGVVILVLLAPYALLAAPVARRAGRLVALAGRAALVRLIIGGLLLMVAGVVAGLVGGLLGRLSRPRGGAPSAAPYVANPAAPQGYAGGYAGGYAAPSPAPAQGYTGGYAMPPQVDPTPTPYYADPTPYPTDAPTTIRDSHA